MINVLVVDDSPSIRAFLVHILSADSSIEQVWTAGNGEEAIEAVEHFQPDVITMDVQMPKMGGLIATRRIMETNPTPIVVVSENHDPSDSMATFNALDAGALVALKRPAGIGHPDHEAEAMSLLNTVKAMAEVKLVRRWAVAPKKQPLKIRPITTPISVVAIGASTGGPPVLNTLLKMLPRDFSLPILIVQHIAQGFTPSLVEWLAQSSSLAIHVATQDEHLLAGHVYVAPDAHQMKIGYGGRIILTQDPPESCLRPSVSYLFRSLPEIYGDRVVAGLLTGMGCDGVAELLTLRQKGAVTFAQDQTSSVVYGMPGEAVKLGAASYVLSPEKMAEFLTTLALNKGRQ